MSGTVPEKLTGLASATVQRIRDRATSTRPGDQDGPAVVYAEVLDGDALTLCVAAHGADAPAVALQAPGSGTVAVELDESRPGEWSGRVDLLGRTGALAAGDDGWLVVDLRRSSPGTALPWAGRPHRTADTPVAAPVSSDGRWRFSVSRRDGVRVAAAPVEDAPRVRDVSVAEHVVTLAFGCPWRPGAVHLVGPAGEAWGELGVDADDDTHADTYVVRIAAATVAVPVGAVADVVVSGPGGLTALRRWHEDVTNPANAVALPQLTGDDGAGTSVVGLAYRRTGTLTVRHDDVSARGEAG